MRQQIRLIHAENQIVVAVLRKADFHAEQDVHPPGGVILCGFPAVDIIRRAGLPVGAGGVERVIIEVIRHHQSGVAGGKVAVDHTGGIEMRATTDLGGVCVQLGQKRHDYFTSMMDSSHISGFS